MTPITDGGRCLLEMGAHYQLIIHWDDRKPEDQTGIRLKNKELEKVASASVL